MRFVPDHLLPASLRPRAVACDGLAEAGLHLSHWPGNRTPARYKADLSTEMALRFAAQGPEERGAYEVATNNHHDADGVLSLFAALRPDAALPRAAELVAAAAFGDFAHGSEERALMLAATLDGLATSPASPLAPRLRGLGPADAAALATEHALGLLPGLLDALPRHEALWGPELAWFRASRDAWRGGALAITELAPARLTVVEAEREPHPAVLDAATRGDLALLALRGEAGWRYRAAWRGYSWAETVSPQRPAIATLPMEKLCLPLNSLEPRPGARWVHEGPGMGATEALRSAAPDGGLAESGLGPGEVAERLAWFLVERGRRG